MKEMPEDSFDDMKFFNPWEVKIDEGALKEIGDIFEKYPLLEGVFLRFLDELKTFPPNEDHFKEPKRSFYEEGVWLTVTDGHIRLALFIEYRKFERVCWVVKVKVDIPRERVWFLWGYRKLD